MTEQRKKLSSPYDLVGINNSVIMYVTIQRDGYKEHRYWKRLTSNFYSKNLVEKMI